MATSKKHWFHNKSPAAQRAYIKKHPNSVFAKKVRPVSQGDIEANIHYGERSAHYSKKARRVQRLIDSYIKRGEKVPERLKQELRVTKRGAAIFAKSQKQHNKHVLGA